MFLRLLRQILPRVSLRAYLRRMYLFGYREQVSLISQKIMVWLLPVLLYLALSDPSELGYNAGW